MNLISDSKSVISTIPYIQYHNIRTHYFTCFRVTEVTPGVMKVVVILKETPQDDKTITDMGMDIKKKLKEIDQGLTDTERISLMDDPMLDFGKGEPGKPWLCNYRPVTFWSVPCALCSV